MTNEIWKKYKPDVTIKKGFWTGLITAIVGILIQAITVGDIQIANAMWVGVILSTLKMIQNYIKHKDN